MVDQVPSLLIVHQNLNMAKTLATLLAREYNVYIARLASHADELVESNRIKVVLASRQLPDSTGLALFTELCRLHPRVIRILLIMEDEKDAAFVEEAMSDGIIHRYLTEPLRSAQFIETVRKAFQLYDESPRSEPVKAPRGAVSAGSDAAAASDAPADEGAPRESESGRVPEPADLELAVPLTSPGPAGPTSEATARQASSDAGATTPASGPPWTRDPDMPASDMQVLQAMQAVHGAASPERTAGNETDELELASRNYEAVMLYQRERQLALDLVEQKQQQIENMEAIQRGLMNEKERLLGEVERLHKEITALNVARQENTRLAEENVRLKEKSDLVTQQAEKLKTEVDGLKSQWEMLEQENTRLQDENSLYRTMAEDIEKENAQLKPRVETLTADVERLRSETSRLTDENAGLKEENEQFARELEETRVQLETWKADSEDSKNMAAAQAERSLLLEQEKAEFEKKARSLETLLSESRARSEELGAQLEKARAQLNSLGMVDGFQVDMTPSTAREIRTKFDPLEIFDKAAEWRTQLSVVQGINKALEHRVRRYEEEVSRLHEKLEDVRAKHDEKQAGLLRESRGFEEQYKSLREELRLRDTECSELQREKADLAGKLLWFQTHWNQRQE